ncbi:hypothetical protein [Micrococcus sp. IITD107]|uniref:hypothetical protein n=1 Tax=Micrococcus sp. IITD107 TaxID=3342790 RepID=UPI0035BB24EB
MAEATGHAAFHLKHVAHGTAGNRADRRGLLHESMRHLNSKNVARHAGKNASIVPADAHLNTGFVNDGTGGFRTVGTVKEVLDYGDARQKRVRRKITEKQVTTNLFVVHLPKTMCVEIPDYYPRRTANGSQRLDPVTGKPMSRSRWVARDLDEALRYFRDAVDHLGGHVIPGGQEAIHGWATNFDESTPHIQIMADPFAPDPKALDDKPDALRTEHNQAYGSHREVRDEAGRQVSGPAKMRLHQAGFREHMVALGWPVESEVSARHGQELSKPEFEAAMDAVAEANAVYDGVRAKSDANHAAIQNFNLDAAEIRNEFEARSTELDEREGELDRREADLPALRRRAETEGHAAGMDAARDQIDHAVQQRLAVALAPARGVLERQREELEEELERAAAERRAFNASAAQFERLSRILEPLVAKWEQANPHTEKGAKAQSLATRIRQIEQRAAKIREASPDHDHEFGG